MPTIHLTQDVLAQLEAVVPDRGAVCLFDAELKGFLLEVRASGGATFYFRYRNAAGIPEVRLHNLRHSFASFLINAGRSLFEVQRLLGHHDPKVTMRYAHLSPQAMLEAVNGVGNVVGRRSGVAANQPQGVVASA